jgi:hypothetical protein
MSIKPLEVIAVSCFFAAAALGGDDKPAAGRPGAHGGPNAPGVDRRQNFQSGRVGDGVRRGQITRDEAPGLVKEQKQIRHGERQQKSDGSLTDGERKQLQEKLSDAGKNLREQKPNEEDRPGLSSSHPAQLGVRSPGIDAREANQARRILQGVRSGQLTAEETKRLLLQQFDIRQNEREFKSDGNLTWEERRQLHHQLNEASRDIYREKHDEERMPWARPRDLKSLANWTPRAVDYEEIARWHHAFFNLRCGHWHWREAARYWSKRELLARLERRFDGDGELSPEERARLKQMIAEIREELRREMLRR